MKIGGSVKADFFSEDNQLRLRHAYRVRSQELFGIPNESLCHDSDNGPPMYIARIHIHNYRCFQDTAIDFQPGLKVIISENNAGKTALLKALGFNIGRCRMIANRPVFVAQPSGGL